MAQTEKRSYLLYFIACFFVIAGGIGLIITNTGSNTRGISTDSNSDDNNDGANIPLPDLPTSPEIPETPRADDPDSEVIEQFIDVNGRRRRFNIFVPGVYARDPTPVPLVFVFHGSLGTAEAIQGSYGMDEVAENENFIAVYPVGEGRNFEVFTLENNKDVDFALAMIDHMKSEFQIRDDAIYSTGYSNGGFLSTILACLHSDIFAAVAPMAATFDSGVFPECSPTEVIPYLQIHGSGDGIVPYNGNRQIVSVEETMAFWANANGQMTTPVITEEEPGFELQSYPADNIVQHYRMIGIGHLNVIDSFPAQKIIDFFKRNTNFGGFVEPLNIPAPPATFNDADSVVLEKTIDVNGRQRDFNVFVPGVYNRNPTAVPLVFVFHGSLGTAGAIQGSYGMDEVAEAENFIVAYPVGEGRNFEVFTLENNKDVDFTLAMIDHLKDEFQIRDDAIYSTGYSNGGFLSTILACVHSDIFAAVAPMAGTFDSAVFPECSPAEVIPYLQIHGSRDSIVPYNGNRQIVSVEETMAFWANANGQMTTPVVTEEEPGFELQSYPADNIVQHYRMLGIGHLNVIDSFPAQKIIDFFKRNTNFGGFVEPLNIPAPPATFNDADSETISMSIDVDGRERDFNIFVPGVYKRNPTAVPLVFVFHGSLGTAGAIQGSYGMDEVAETENFIAVYPVGEGRNFEVFTFENNKDIAFALAMIDFMKSEYQIKSNSIYSTGYSNGGFLSTMLACAHTDVFAAVAPMAATFDTGVFPECAPSGIIPYLQIHGSSDSIVPYNGNRQIVSVEETINFWAEANGQQETPVVTDEVEGQLFSFQPDNIVQHYRLNRIGHLNVIDAFPAQTIIDFFKRVSDF